MEDICNWKNKDLFRKGTRIAHYQLPRRSLYWLAPKSPEGTKMNNYSPAVLSTIKQMQENLNNRSNEGTLYVTTTASSHGVSSSRQKSQYSQPYMIKAPLSTKLNLIFNYQQSMGDRITNGSLSTTKAESGGTFLDKSSIRFVSEMKDQFGKQKLARSFDGSGIIKSRRTSKITEQILINPSTTTIAAFNTTYASDYSPQSTFYRKDIQKERSSQELRKNCYRDRQNRGKFVGSTI
jgi:hypothetical protein